jgi:uncharacterized membrane protein
VNDADGWPVVAGPEVAIIVMALATYGCRLLGFVLMSRVRITPAIERALGALPGCIVVATVVPIAWRSGPDAILGLAAGILVMWRFKNELVALVVGMATVAAARALGV